jgi:hypothetical protein
MLFEVVMCRADPILWVDNFSHFMSRSVPTMAANAYSSCLWSGTCDFECLVPGLSDAVVVIPQTGVLVPAIPNRLLHYMPGVMAALRFIERKGVYTMIYVIGQATIM